MARGRQEMKPEDFPIFETFYCCTIHTNTSKYTIAHSYYCINNISLSLATCLLLHPTIYYRRGSSGMRCLYSILWAHIIIAMKNCAWSSLSFSDKSFLGILKLLQYISNSLCGCSVHRCWIISCIYSTPALRYNGGNQSYHPESHQLSRFFQQLRTHVSY